MRPGRGEAGAALVEFAVVSVPLVLLLLGIVTYGLLFGQQQAITHAASQAAREAVTLAPPTAAGVDARAAEVTGRELSWLAGHTTAAELLAPDAAGCEGATRGCVRVTVTTEPLLDGLLPVPAVLTAAAVLELEDG